MVFDPDTNARGAELIPVVNAFANGLNDFPIYDQNLQVSKDFQTPIFLKQHNVKYIKSTHFLCLLD